MSAIECRPAAKQDDKARNGDDGGPALLAFLQFLDNQMAAHPEWIVEADELQLQRISELAGVDNGN